MPPPMLFLSFVSTLHEKLLRNWRKKKSNGLNVECGQVEGMRMRWNVTVEGHLDDTLVDAEDKVVRVL